ncbi:hypothetical protein GCM10010468_34840 [Actinocorallia longicatena]|uniref:Uncharacterized protein n=1 Tax=Actinocorallia longicatena TaxID=111803 RepID=A0ABP6QA85_9ACTN
MGSRAAAVPGPVGPGVRQEGPAGAPGGGDVARMIGEISSVGAPRERRSRPHYLRTITPTTSSYLPV